MEPTTMQAHERSIKVIERSEVISLELPMNQSQDRDFDRVDPPNYPWSKSAGIFKTDPQFEDFQQEIQSYRNELDELNS
jgi:hypothetical protein